MQVGMKQEGKKAKTRMSFQGALQWTTSVPSCPILGTLMEGTREPATLTHLFISFHPHWLKPTGLAPLHFQVVHV